jgi:hypothetical protein
MSCASTRLGDQLLYLLFFQIDDFDVFKKRMLMDKKDQPYKRALLFVDNSGADVVLGMLPLTRELLRHGTEV